MNIRRLSSPLNRVKGIALNGLRMVRIPAAAIGMLAVLALALINAMSPTRELYPDLSATKGSPASMAKPADNAPGSPVSGITNAGSATTTQPSWPLITPDTVDTITPAQSDPADADVEEAPQVTPDPTTPPLPEQPVTPAPADPTTPPAPQPTPSTPPTTEVPPASSGVNDVVDLLAAGVSGLFGR